MMHLDPWRSGSTTVHGIPGPCKTFLFGVSDYDFRK